MRLEERRVTYSWNTDVGILAPSGLLEPGQPEMHMDDIRHRYTACTGPLECDGLDQGSAERLPILYVTVENKDKPNKS
jgi:hypothetical protein